MTAIKDLAEDQQAALTCAVVNMLAWTANSTFVEEELPMPVEVQKRVFPQTAEAFDILLTVLADAYEVPDEEVTRLVEQHHARILHEMKEKVEPNVGSRH